MYTTNFINLKNDQNKNLSVPFSSRTYFPVCSFTSIYWLQQYNQSIQFANEKVSLTNCRVPIHEGDPLCLISFWFSSVLDDNFKVCNVGCEVESLHLFLYLKCFTYTPLSALDYFPQWNKSWSHNRVLEIHWIYYLR